jgi:7,8-dihydropterin-6-yl-methyl-4-(beta-D-ribofuranosyl)aminobenzene 5'-phosphate synthase
MTLKITTLIENQPGEHKALMHEHGLSLYIEKDDCRILFDTGQSAAFLHNAKQMKIDLGQLDYVALSHGHYDHSGGFTALTKVNKNFELYTGVGFFNEKYGFNDNTPEYLGNNFNENFLADNGIKHHFVNQQVLEIYSGVFIITGFIRSHADEIVNPRFRIFKDNAFYPDQFDDEIMLAIDTPKGLAVLLGCSHPGMKNMLDTAEKLLKKPIYAVIGGTHLVEADEASLDISMAYLKKNTIQVIGVSHCTGQTAMDRLSRTNDRYSCNRTGSFLLI